ncbi:hypothetical protein VFPPC_18623 [Pochonia chlamydosporia 170]|uniref:Uncharacterized protein n=1 Tax=Pochonia chlamydosporia 170 TaxID=1380566 RepID=A0A219AQ76_METCM|nr:hypothetical protein VFPPC_18623 [Pochonia chlamydosporia 170]OWT42285.1 hypothetical protein VFPPC_18623 [Pochonia chlamydosporia 170]
MYDSQCLGVTELDTPNHSETRMAVSRPNSSKTRCACWTQSTTTSHRQLSPSWAYSNYWRNFAVTHETRCIPGGWNGGPDRPRSPLALYHIWSGDILGLLWPLPACTAS